jgi:hypothetical protein
LAKAVRAYSRLLSFFLYMYRWYMDGQVMNGKLRNITAAEAQVIHVSGL